MDKPLNVVLLLAGGHGFRMHTDRPKQFMEIAGEPVISYTLQAFQRLRQPVRIALLDEGIELLEFGGLPFLSPRVVAIEIEVYFVKPFLAVPR